jgi:uncharacterized delta-60 repeat protein
MDVKLRLLAAALVALTAHTSPAGAAPGDLDSSFSNDGRVSTLTSPDTFVPRAVAVQPDGRIVVAGYSCDTGTCGPTGDSSFRLVRYTADGGLDTDFGAGGMVTTGIGAGRSQAFDVLVRPDGRIIAGGVASVNAADPGSFALAGYRPDGRVDTNFGPGGSGHVVMPVGDGFDAVSDLVAGRGGRVIAVGQAEVLGHDRVALARFDQRGAPDSKFDGNGSLTVPSGAQYAYAAGGTLLPDGRVVAVGASGRSSAVQDLRLSGVAIDADGGAGPPWLRPVGASYSFANAAVALPDGRVLSAGVATDRSRFPGMALTRTSPEGAPDPSFGGDGAALVRVRDSSVAADVVLEPGGRAVAAGDSSSGADHSFMLARLDGAGGLDRSFGFGGVVLTGFPGATVARATALALQADGKLVAAGIACVAGSGAQCGGGTARLALARYQGGDAAAPGPSGPGAGTPPAGGGTPRRAPFVSLPGRVRARHGRVKIRVRCRQAKRCRGRLSLRRLRTGRRSLLLGARTVSVAGHHARTFKVKLRRKRLGTHRKLRVRIEFAGRDATGAKRRVTRRATLRRG